MIKLFTAAETRAIEAAVAERGVSYLEMMETAGKNTAKFIFDEFDASGKQVAVLVGKGNNGGDGLVIARRLQKMGVRPLVILAEGEVKTPDALHNLEQLPPDITVYTYPDDRTAIEDALYSADIIADAVYGIGFHGELKPALQELFTAADKSNAVRVAVDIPSGVTADNGRVSACSFRADYTVALGGCKPAHYSYPSYNYCGKVVLRSFGETEAEVNAAPSSAITGRAEDILPLLPKRGRDTHKGSFGKLLNVAGSVGMSGAAILSTRAALRMGAGLVTLASPRTLVTNLTPALTECTFAPLAETNEGRISRRAVRDILDRAATVSACCVGCGLGQSEDGRQIVRALLQSAACPLIIDADGINCLSGSIDMIKTAAAGKHGKTRVLLTPHPLEFSRLTGLSVSEIQSNRIDYAKSFAESTGALVLLKGSRTVIASPDGRVYVNATGNSGLSKGGSGDVLTGIIGGLAAQGLSLFDSAIIGSCIHGAAADYLADTMSEYSILPSDLIGAMGPMLKSFDR